MAKQIDYPADTVDASGKVWDTVGENIRKGNKASSSIIKSIYGDDCDIIYADVNIPSTGIIKTSVSSLISNETRIIHANKNIVGFFIVNINGIKGDVNTVPRIIICTRDKKTELSLKNTTSDNCSYSISLLLVVK